MSYNISFLNESSDIEVAYEDNEPVELIDQHQVITTHNESVYINKESQSFLVSFNFIFFYINKGYFWISIVI